MSVKRKNNNFTLISLICGAVLVIGRTVSVLIAGSPFDMIHKLDNNRIIPPIWLLNLLFSIMCFLLGCVAGSIICEIKANRVGCDKQISAYKGGMYFLSAYFLTLFHYSLFFIREQLLLSMTVSLIVAICSALCAVNWAKLSSFATLVLSAYALFFSYLFLINLFILFGN